MKPRFTLGIVLILLFLGHFGFSSGRSQQDSSDTLGIVETPKNWMLFVLPISKSGIVQEEYKELIQDLLLSAISQYPDLTIRELESIEPSDAFVLNDLAKDETQHQYVLSSSLHQIDRTEDIILTLHFFTYPQLIAFHSTSLTIGDSSSIDEFPRIAEEFLELVRVSNWLHAAEFLFKESSYEASFDYYMRGSLETQFNEELIFNIRKHFAERLVRDLSNNTLQDALLMFPNSLSASWSNRFQQIFSQQIRNLPRMLDQQKRLLRRSIQEALRNQQFNLARSILTDDVFTQLSQFEPWIFMEWEREISQHESQARIRTASIHLSQNRFTEATRSLSPILHADPLHTQALEMAKVIEQKNLTFLEQQLFRAGRPEPQEPKIVSERIISNSYGFIGVDDRLEYFFIRNLGFRTDLSLSFIQAFIPYVRRQTSVSLGISYWDSNNRPMDSLLLMVDPKISVGLLIGVQVFEFGISSYAGVIGLGGTKILENGESNFFAMGPQAGLQFELFGNMQSIPFRIGLVGRIGWALWLPQLYGTTIGSIGLEVGWIREVRAGQ